MSPSVGILYERTENDHETVIRFSRYLPALVLIAATYLTLVILVRNVWLAVFASLLVVFIMSRDMRTVRQELMAAQREGRLTRSGRRMSFRSPLTYVITKKRTKRPRKGKRRR